MASSKSKPQAKHSMFDLEKQYIFYASYHNNPINVLIHLICIWNIAASGLVFFQYTPSLAPMPNIVEQYVGTGLSVNVALILCLFYSAVYLRMEPFLGFVGEFFEPKLIHLAFDCLPLAATLMWGAIYYKTGTWVASDAFFFGYPVLQVAIGVHVGCWILQFSGHGIFEGRAPALLDSWDQAFITAPLFVLMELALLFGYRRAFHEKCMVEVEKNIAEFRKKNSD